MRSHGSEREIVAGRKADYAANSGLTLGDEQTHALDIQTFAPGFDFQGSEVIFKYERARIGRISNASRTSISGAKIAGGVVS